MVSHAVLRKVVGADLLTAIPAANLRFALPGKLSLLALKLHFVETRAQNSHRLLAILDLRLFVLAAHNRIRRNVRDAHRRVSGVHRLASRTRRAESIDANVLRLDLNVDVLRLGQHGHGYSRSVHSSLLLRFGNTLDAVHAALILELRVGAAAFDHGNDFLQSANSRFGT